MQKSVKGQLISKCLYYGVIVWTKKPTKFFEEYVQTVTLKSPFEINCALLFVQELQDLLTFYGLWFQLEKFRVQCDIA